jgi:hypothetical protein
MSLHPLRFLFPFEPAREPDEPAGPHLSSTWKLAHVLVALMALALALACLVRAQPQPTRALPQLAFAYPAGGQQGATFTVAVGGQHLAGTSAAIFSTPGIIARVTGHERPLTQKEINDLRERLQALQDKCTAHRADPTKPAFTADDESTSAAIRQTLATRGNRQVAPALAETVTLEITILDHAPVGDHEFRLRTPAGLSPPLAFCVGELPEFTSDVATATSAREITRIRPPDAAGRLRTARAVSLPAVINGQILPGEVDRFAFSARQGQRLTFAVAARTLIPYLADAVPGWFQATLAVFDSNGRELAYADDERFNPDPVIACEIPADGTYLLEIKDALYRGREDFVYRITAGELPLVRSVFPLGVRAGESAPVALEGWNLPSSSLEIAEATRPPGTYLLSVRGHGSQSNAVRFAVDSRPSSRETDCNDTPAEAQRVTFPATVDGRIERAGDVDFFRFTGAAGQEVVAEVLARRLGSPVDSTLSLSDAGGRRLAANDDSEDKGLGLLTHHADSRLRFKLPADGDYVLRLDDAQQQGGPDYGYRLVLGAPQPDFDLRVVPSTLNVHAGATTTFMVHALRRDGFRGEIDLGLQHAPPGFVLTGARLPAGEDTLRVTLKAPSNASGSTFALTVVGRATVDGRPLVRRAQAADNRMQAFAYQHLVSAKELRVGVTSRASTPRPRAKQPGTP